MCTLSMHYAANRIFCVHAGFRNESRVGWPSLVIDCKGGSIYLAHLKFIRFVLFKELIVSGRLKPISFQETNLYNNRGLWHILILDLYNCKASYLHNIQFAVKRDKDSYNNLW